MICSCGFSIGLGFLQSFSVLSAKLSVGCLFDVKLVIEQWNLNETYGYKCAKYIYIHKYFFSFQKMGENLFLFFSLYFFFPQSFDTRLNLNVLMGVSLL